MQATIELKGLLLVYNLTMRELADAHAMKNKFGVMLSVRAEQFG